MRTTVTIDDGILDQAKHLAVREGRTMGSVLEDALRMFLERAEVRPAAPLALPVFRGRPGLRPGVDLDDREALYDLLDQDDDEDAAGQ